SALDALVEERVRWAMGSLQGVEQIALVGTLEAGLKAIADCDERSLQLELDQYNIALGVTKEVKSSLDFVFKDSTWRSQQAAIGEGIRYASRLESRIEQELSTLKTKWEAAKQACAQ